MNATISLRELFIAAGRGALVITILLAAVGQSLADPIEPSPRPKDGWVYPVFHSKNGVTFKFYVTDAKGADIDAINWPRDVVGWGGSVDGEQVWSGETTIPAKVQKAGTGTKDSPPEFLSVDDYRHEVYRGNVKVAALNVESLIADMNTGEFAMVNVFGTLADSLGVGAVLAVPSLAGDTNGDGVVGGDGDLLYSLVELNAYLNGGMPTFGFDDVFHVTGGLVDGLPGMMFSTTPFAFASDTGFVGTPYTGEALVTGVTNLSATVPEPSALVSCSFGALSLLSLRLRRARSRKTQRDANRT